MQLDELMAQIGRLLEAHEARRGEDPGEGNFRCEGCVGCYSCRFCVDCDGCEDCTYCEACVDCAKCTHCKRSVSCGSCTYVEDSRDCEDGRYLTLCVDCERCVHCLGCVGLVDAEFYVLNEKYSRKAYFSLLRAVQEELALRVASGWRPAFAGLDVSASGVETEGSEGTPWVDPASLAGDAAPSTGHDEDEEEEEEEEGWAWRDQTGVEDPPPPSALAAEGAASWVDAPQRETTWHGEEELGWPAADAPGPAAPVEAESGPGAPDVEREGTGDRSSGEAPEGAPHAGVRAPRAGAGLARAARPQRPPAPSEPSPPADLLEPGRGHEDREGSGRGGRGSGGEGSWLLRAPRPRREGEPRATPGAAAEQASRGEGPADRRGAAHGLSRARRPARPGRPPTSSPPTGEDADER